MPEQKDIKYLNKQFSTFKSDLIEYAKAYFPNVYNDFTVASPGTMFIEMAAYVGDVLSFYLDNQLQETFLQYAKQPNNLYTLAYMMGYRPKVTSAASVDIDVYQTVPSIQVLGEYQPDWDYALSIHPGMKLESRGNSSVTFYVPNRIDFSESSSYDPTEVTVYQEVAGNPTDFLLRKSVKAMSGEQKTQTFTFNSPIRFANVTIQDSNIITITDVIDSDENRWYEVPYLAQDYVYNAVENTAANYPLYSQYSNQVPYMLERLSVPRRFTTRVLSNKSLVLEFGPGVNTVSDEAIIPDPNSVGVGLTANYLDSFTASFDPTNYVTTQTYGLAPKNTTLTVKYLVGGGASANVNSNTITIVSNKTVTGNNTSRQNTIAVNNPAPATGGGDADTTEEIRLNSLGQINSQLRAVTQQDYMTRVLSMHPKFGKVSKVFVTKDDATFSNYTLGDSAQRDQIAISLYALSLDTNRKLAQPSPALVKNIQTYLSDYRLLTDAINIKTGYIINIGCNFDVIIRPDFSGQDVISRCLIQLKDFFNINNWQINQPIILSNIYSLLDQVEGVQTVKKVEIVNKSGLANGYSKYSYDIPGATLNSIVYPSLDPSIFEVKYPDSDIQGRVVTF